MVPSFEKRVRAFAIDTSGAVLALIIAIPLKETIAWIIATAAFLGFYFIPHFITPGQTFGKRIQKIKIVRLDDSPVPVYQAVLRDLFRIIFSIGTFGIYLIIAFFVLSDKTSRTIHDYIFKTKVIDLEKPNPRGKDQTFRTETMKKRGF